MRSRRKKKEKRNKKKVPRKSAGRDGGRSKSKPDSQSFKGRQKKKITSSGTVEFQS
jgi:hypothetical protein